MNVFQSFILGALFGAAVTVFALTLWFTFGPAESHTPSKSATKPASKSARPSTSVFVDDGENDGFGDKVFDLKTDGSITAKPLDHDS